MGVNNFLWLLNCNSILTLLVWNPCWTPKYPFCDLKHSGVNYKRWNSLCWIWNANNFRFQKIIKTFFPRWYSTIADYNQNWSPFLLREHFYYKQNSCMHTVLNPLPPTPYVWENKYHEHDQLRLSLYLVNNFIEIRTILTYQTKNFPTNAFPRQYSLWFD